MTTEAQYLTELANLRAQELWKGWSTKDLQLIAALATVSGGGGNGGSTSPTDIAQGIDTSSYIDSILNQLFEVNSTLTKLNSGGSSQSFASFGTFDLIVTDVPQNVVPLNETVEVALFNLGTVNVIASVNTGFVLNQRITIPGQSTIVKRLPKNQGGITSLDVFTLSGTSNLIINWSN